MILKALLTPLLIPISWIYGLGLRLDRWRKTLSRVKLPVPVISIGNLTWGGTGKTPLLLKLVADLKSKKSKSAILTRGYKGLGHEGLPGQSDEVLLMSRRFPEVPHGVGANRVEAAQKLLKSYPIDVFVLDDGFQHWKIERNLDIVTVDATDPWGGGHLIPWGRLRESKSALKRSHVVVLTRTELVGANDLEQLRTEVQELAGHDRVFPSTFDHTLINWRGEKQDLKAALDQMPVLAVSAIGNPRSYEANLQRLGAVVTPARFPDHHHYIEKDLSRLEKEAFNIRASIVVTEKDEMKLRETRWGRPHGGPIEIYVLRAELRFSADDESRWKKIIHEFSKP